MEKIYDVAGLAGRLDVGLTSAYKLMRTGEVKAARVGTLWRVTESSILDFLHGKDDGKHVGKTEIQEP